MEVSQALTGTLNLPAGLYGVLEVLERRCGARARRDDAAGGGERDSSRWRRRWVSRPAGPGPVPHGGRGHRGGRRVGGAGGGAEGEPRAALPAPGRGPRPATEETTFLCVPIVLDGATAGTLGIELAWHPGREPERWIKALRITGAMISQALRIQRLIDAERRKLVEENTQLRQELRERYEFTHIIGNSGPMRRVFEQIAQVVGTTATVLDPGRDRAPARSSSPTRCTTTRRGRASPSCGSTAPRCPRRCSSPSCSATSAARSPARRPAGRAASSWPTAARSSSTRSAS